MTREVLVGVVCATPMGMHAHLRGGTWISQLCEDNV